MWNLDKGEKYISHFANDIQILNSLQHLKHFAYEWSMQSCGKDDIMKTRNIHEGNENKTNK